MSSISVSRLVVPLAIVACLGLAGAVFAKKVPPPLHSVDLNSATEKQLEQLPGVGPTTANAIIQFRVKSGRFRRVEDLLAIRGISETKLDKMRPYIIVGPAPPPAKKPAPPPAAPAQSNH